MDAGVTEIGVDEENRLGHLHRKTDRQIHGSQGFTLAVPRARDSQLIPIVFSQTMYDLGPQNLNGIDKRPLVIGSHHAMLTKHREWNIQRLGPGIDDGRRHGMAAGSLSSLWPATRLLLLILIKLQRSPKSVHLGLQ
jgi:hypothetical protein